MMDSEPFWWRRFERNGPQRVAEYGVRVERSCRQCLLQGVGYEGVPHDPDMLVMRIVLVWNRHEIELWRLKTIRAVGAYPIIADMDR